MGLGSDWSITYLWLDRALASRHIGLARRNLQQAYERHQVAEQWFLWRRQREDRLFKGRLKRE